MEAVELAPLVDWHNASENVKTSAENYAGTIAFDRVIRAPNGTWAIFTATSESGKDVYTGAVATDGRGYCSCRIGRNPHCCKHILRAAMDLAKRS